MPDTPDPKPGRTIDFTYRYRPGQAPPLYYPSKDPLHLEGGKAEWECVAEKMIEGNLTFVRYIEECQAAYRGEPQKYGSQVIELSDSDVLLEPTDESGFPLQLPMAMVLGCVDARAPAEIVFGMEFVNDVFNVRLAGNVLAQEGLGSVQYALRHLVREAHHDEGGADGEKPQPPEYPKRLRLVISLGHEGCGAVAEAVRAFQNSPTRKPVATGSVAALLGHLFFPSVIVGSEAFDMVNGTDASRNPDNFGRFSQLVAYLNAAWGAHVMKDRVIYEGEEMMQMVGVVYGVFDPRDMRVRAVPNLKGKLGEDKSSFGLAPASLDALREFALSLAKAQAEPDNDEFVAPLLGARAFMSGID